MNAKRPLHLLLYTLLLAFIAGSSVACGDDGGGGGDNGGSEGNGENGENGGGNSDVAFADVPVVSEPSTSIAGTSHSASFQLVDDANAPVSVADVGMTVTLSQHEFAAGGTTLTATTNADGIAEVSFAIETAAMGYTLAASSGHTALDGVSTSTSAFDITADAASALHSSISGTDGIVDDPAGAEITIVLLDAYENPVAGIVPEFSASGAENTYNICSSSDDQGVSTCTMTSTIAEQKTLNLTAPVQVNGETVEFLLACDDDATAFGGGDGAADTPYVICTAAHLNAIGTDSHYMASDFIVARDIDLASVENFNMIGEMATRYTGVFNGNRKRISNLTINRPSIRNVGLFGYIGLVAEVKHLYLENVDITGRVNVGAIAGRMDGGSLFNSYATGVVTGQYNIGGLIGSIWASMVGESYAAVDVTGVDGSIGGLAGDVYLHSTIRNTYATGDVVGHPDTATRVGGLVGRNERSALSNSYATGSVTGKSEIGGLVGNIESATATTTSYWDTDTSAMNSSAEGAGYTTTKFADASNFPEWDFENIWVIGTAPDGETRPILQWQND